MFLLHVILKHFKVSNRSKISCRFGGVVGASKVMIVMKEVDQGKQQLNLTTVLSFVSDPKSSITYRISYLKS